jgi:hypothetical protein
MEALKVRMPGFHLICLDPGGFEGHLHLDFYRPSQLRTTTQDSKLKITLESPLLALSAV